jgi:serine/threonine protein kinase
MSLTYRNNINDNNNLKNLSKCIELINKSNFTKISNGQQGDIFKVVSKDCGSLIIKKRIIKEKDKKWKDNQIWLIEQLLIEYKIMTLTNRMVNKFICPNFILAYDFNQNNGYLLLEYADGDSRFLFKDEFYDDNIYKSYICQSLIAMYAFNKYTTLHHRDVKPDNILYKKINKNIVFHYKINNDHYYVPTYGYLFMLTDYGSSGFLLKERVEDIINFDHSIIKDYLMNYSIIYPNLINAKDFDIYLKDVFFFQKDRLDITLKTMLEYSKKLQNVKNIKMNKCVFELHNILTSSNDLLNIIDKYYSDFTDKSNSGDIVDFVMDF